VPDPIPRPGRSRPTPSVLLRRRAGTLAVATLVVLGSGLAVTRLIGGGGGSPVDAGAFAPGACVAFSPSSGTGGRTVFLDAGHGGPDPGAVGATENGRSIHEADLTLAVELDALTVLRKAGYRVVVSRTGETSVARLTPADRDGPGLSLQGAHDDVVAREDCADRAHADVLVGIYFDAGASAHNAGCLTAYDADRPFSAANLRLADLLQRDVLAAMDRQGWEIPDQGVVPDGGVGSISGNPSAGGLAAAAAAYGHLLLLGPPQAGYAPTPSTMPGAVIEPLYVTDPFEASRADSATGQMVMARGISRAVEQFLR
jgi:N-acetylmuramoyl-L-alanine amidase